MWNGLWVRAWRSTISKNRDWRIVGVTQLTNCAATFYNSDNDIVILDMWWERMTPAEAETLLAFEAVPEFVGNEFYKIDEDYRVFIIKTS